MSKRFSLAEAQSLIPQVDRLLRDALALKLEYEGGERALHAFTERIMLMGGIVVDREKAIEAKHLRETAAGRLRAVIEEVQEIGCLIKDLDTGLIDFPHHVPRRRSVSLLEAGRNRDPVLARGGRRLSRPQTH